MNSKIIFFGVLTLCFVALTTEAFPAETNLQESLESSEDLPISFPASIAEEQALTASNPEIRVKRSPQYYGGGGFGGGNRGHHHGGFGGGHYGGHNGGHYGGGHYGGGHYGGGHYGGGNRHHG